MKHLAVMIKPASALCNLRCKYCFYANISDLREVRSFGVMTPVVTDKILANIRADLAPGDNITFAFQGGEPTLAGLDFFKHFTEVVDDWHGIRVSYALQTNAILLDEDWCEFLKAHGFLVGVSWDILKNLNDEARVDPNGRGTNERILASVALLRKYGVDFNILCTLTNFVARHSDQVWKILKANDIRHVQFTPCLDDFDKDGASPYALTPKRFASFYDHIFNHWYAEYKNGDYRSVKLFDDIIWLIAYGVPTACGINGLCQRQMVVEADGSVYPCDFYCVDNWKLGSFVESSIQQIFESPTMVSFADRDHYRPKICFDCKFNEFCGGNCERMQRQICCPPDGNFCGYQSFLQAHMQELYDIALVERNRG